MELLLVRHGQAIDDVTGLDDAARWLTERGRKVTHRVARWLVKRKKRRPAVLWSSPLVRAVQTAEILAAACGPDAAVLIAPELSPGRDPGDLIARLSTLRKEDSGPLALVGHEPSLSLLAKALLGDIGLGSFKKSGVVGLSWENGEGSFRFVLDLAEMKAKKTLDRIASADAPRSRRSPRVEAPPLGEDD